MKTFTNNSKIRVWDREFKIVDLREKSTMFQGDESYYGSSRTMVLQGSYSEADKAESKSWEDATELQNGSQIWIDGASYYLIVTDIKSSDGIMFMTQATYNYTMKTFKEVAERIIAESNNNDLDAQERLNECGGY